MVIMTVLNCNTFYSYLQYPYDKYTNVKIGLELIRMILGKNLLISNYDVFKIYFSIEGGVTF